MTKTVIACIRQAKEDMQSDWKEVERIAASDDCLRIVEQVNDGWKGKACGYKATESIASFHEVAWEGPLPPELTEVADELLSNCFSLRRVKFGKKVTKIGAGAFSDCAAIRSMKLPESVTYIGNSAFWNCRSLQRLYIPAGCQTVKQSTLGNCPSLEILYIPRIIHDQNETKRVFGDLTNPSITWQDPGMPRPDWHDDEGLPELAFEDDEFDEERAPETAEPLPSVCFL